MAKGRKPNIDEWETDDNLLRIKGWARDGYTDKQIAEDWMHVSERTLTRWKNKSESILSALKEGRAPVDVEIEDALAKSAMGFKITLRKPIKLRTEKEKKGEGKIIEERIEYVEEEQYIPPRDVAMIFWLKNRKPDQWKDKREQVVSTKDGMLADLISGLKEPAEDE